MRTGVAERPADVTSLHLTVKSQAELSPLASCATLQELNLWGDSLQSIDLSPLASCTALQKLELHGDGLQSIDLSPLASCDALQSLELHGSSLRSIDLSTLASCDALQSLVLDARRVYSIDLSPLASCDSLQSLELHGSSLRSIDLSPLASLTALRRLVLHIRVVGSIDLSPIASCTALQELVLPTHDPDSILMLPLASCSRLRHFQVVGNAALDWPKNKDLAPLVWCIHLGELMIGDPARSEHQRLPSVPDNSSEWSEFRRFVDSVRPSVYRSNVVLYVLGISDLGFLDADLFPVFRSVPASASIDEARRAIREALIPPRLRPDRQWRNDHRPRHREAGQ